MFSMDSPISPQAREELSQSLSKLTALPEDQESATKIFQKAFKRKRIPHDLLQRRELYGALIVAFTYNR